MKKHPIFIKLLVASVLFVAINFSANSQHKELELAGGLANYRGELPSDFLKYSGASVGVRVRRFFNDYVALRTGLTFDYLNYNSTNDAEDFLSNRALDFQTKKIASSFSLEYYFFDFLKKNRGEGLFSPYIHLGASVSFFWNKYNSPHLIEASKHSSFAFSMPLGIGVKKSLTKGIFIGLEFTSDFMFSDALDGIEDLTRNKYSSANKVDLDNVFFLGVTLTKRFTYVNCPPSVNP